MILIIKVRKLYTFPMKTAAKFCSSNFVCGPFVKILLHQTFVPCSIYYKTCPHKSNFQKLDAAHCSLIIMLPVWYAMWEISWVFSLYSRISSVFLPYLKGNYYHHLSLYQIYIYINACTLNY